MKPEQLFEALNEIDDAKLEHSEQSVSKVIHPARWGTLAACACVAIVLLAVLPSMIHSSKNSYSESAAMASDEAAKDTAAGASDVIEEAASEENASEDTTVADQLPAFQYETQEPILCSIMEYFLPEKEAESGTVTIPAYYIIKTEKASGGLTAVYGNFWEFTYHLEGTTLVCDSGGEAPGVIYLTGNEETGYQVDHFNRVRDGSYYTDDLARICGADSALKKEFEIASDASNSATKATRESFLKEYIISNNLNIDSYQDYGWDPVILDFSQ